ncbi:hypothetical protein SPRG_11768 [Saprolegnia parasitica CBS 223.65]|uniref:Cilia- and flagella-associated protein 206 n=1 Tax=Saprolegnia parasitica (strain CBS 223.65) TaxID=695850 RepID=A0A067BWK6_SAPPC|nr:hypothetical protein SPRG_11768 [Saprolegnia parasitica CBS 223.65]KDO22924.1 hypothetical protein SPRG_11768 [Saprolegnia parasitica CBS 223.65]|eukprot:XP_012206361.1 hypothetical protein SPRG_11768 [Saprolegnia parasitica CBS 223.65]
MLDRIGKVVADIIARCKYEGVLVSDTLAAFICRTIVQEDSNVFCLDGDIDAAGLAELTKRSVDMLLRKDSPSLETIKMQLDFDLCYVKHEEDVEKAAAMKEKKIANLHKSIVALQPSGTSDFEALTTLYRQIFTMLMVHADADKANDRTIEREVAAALESVFPRIGLKSFVSMSPDDKKFQLKELANIVGGIRLFNKEIGKGGAGIVLSIDTIRDNVASISKSVALEVDEVNQICTDYTEVLLHIHHYNAQSASGVANLKRWQEELNNKRQFLSYMQSLHEDIDVSSDKIGRLVTSFETELHTLKSLVGSRTSLPKGQVYPIFEALSKAWDELEVEHQLLLARSRSIKALMEFKDSYTRTLGQQSEWILKAKRAGMPPQEEWFEHSEPDNQAYLVSSASTASHKDSAATAHGDASAAVDNVPIRMSVDSTPEFMQLPLEYQGYCPWTIVQRGGLLLPGDPSLGVIQYHNAYHVFVNERALSDFMASPDTYISAVHAFVVHRPELIYLLRLQESFPDTSMASLMKLLNNKAHVHPLLAPHAVLKVDASTSTPVHFVEKNIDSTYDWNEWSLRRRALRVANLRNCKTTSAQTTLSNFRSDVDAQVWLPAENATQTGTDRGTNPTKTVTYFAGLRGAPSGFATSKYAEEKGADDDGKTNDDEQDEAKASDAKETPAILSYTFEL